MDKRQAPNKHESAMNNPLIETHQDATSCLSRRAQALLRTQLADGPKPGAEIEAAAPRPRAPRPHPERRGGADQ
jgi:hypothetical protein